MAVITIEGLTKRFGEVVAVDDLSFKVDQHPGRPDRPHRPAGPGPHPPGRGAGTRLVVRRDIT